MSPTSRSPKPARVCLPKVKKYLTGCCGQGRRIFELILPFIKPCQAEQDDIALAAIDEELSQAVRQAILAEYARKISQVKTHFAKKILESEQQFQDLQAVLTDTEQQKQAIQTGLTEAQNRWIEQNAKQALLEQRWIDAEKRLKEIEGLYQNTLLSQERMQAEKTRADKRPLIGKIAAIF